MGGIGAGVLSWLGGAEISPIAGATALAVAPAVAGFLLLPRCGQDGVAAGLAGVWLLAAVGLSAGAGAAWSPLAVMFVIPPALAAMMRRTWIAEMGAISVLGFVGASFLADGADTEALGPFAKLMAAFSLVYVTGLLVVLGQTRTKPAPAPTPAAIADAQARIAEISHEFRTPLTHILGFAEIIETQIFGEIGPRNVEYAGLIRTSGRHLLDLVNDLLDLSKLEAGRYELEFALFDANALVEEAVRLSAESARKKEITLEARIPAAPLMVRADPLALRRMLMNVVGNAIKFTPEHGRVAVSARAEAGRLLFEVEDNGPGMSKQERESLGQAYQRGASGAGVEGTGLGLSLVRGLALAHGGGLSFDAAPEGGALVRIDLPLANGSAKPNGAHP